MIHFEDKYSNVQDITPYVNVILKLINTQRDPEVIREASELVEGFTPREKIPQNEPVLFLRGTHPYAPALLFMLSELVNLDNTEKAMKVFSHYRNVVSYKSSEVVESDREH